MANKTFSACHCIFPFIICRLGHIVDRYHVSMAHAHVHSKVQYLRVNLEIVGDSSVDNCVPPIGTLCRLCRIEADTIAPKMTDASNLIFKLLKRCLRSYIMCIFDKLEVEHAEVGVYVNALVLRVDVLVYKHEV